MTMANMMVAAALLPVLPGSSMPPKAFDPVASGGACPDVLDYASSREAPNQSWDYRSPQLTIIGASHVRGSKADVRIRPMLAVRAANVEACSSRTCFQSCSIRAVPQCCGDYPETARKGSRGG